MNQSDEKPQELLSKNGKALSRRSLLKGGAAGMALAAVAVVPKAASASGGGHGSKRMTIKVANAVFTDGPGAGTSVNNFVIVGDIVEVNSQAHTGTFFCKGVAFFNSDLGDSPSPMAVTHADQRFQIHGKGSIIGAGAEGEADVPTVDDMAIIGGTGKWVGASGSYSGVSGGPKPFTSDGVIVFEFKLRRGR